MHSNQSRSTVLVFAKGYPPIDGGIETYSREISKAYIRLGFQVIVVTACPDPRRSYVDEGILVLNVGMGNQLIVFIKMLTLCLSKTKLRSVNIVHATTWRVLIPFLLQRLNKRAITIVTVHGREVLYLPWYLKKLKKIVLSKANIVVGVSKTALLAAYKGQTIPEKAVVSFNGINPPKMQEADYQVNDKIQILSFCRLVKRKNIELCIRAIANLKGKTKSDFEYRIAGSGPELENLKMLTKSLGVEDVVKFLGRVDDDYIPRMYSNCDIFLHPQIALDEDNDIEGFGLTIADAMSYGKPVIVGVDGGPKEFVKNDEFGYVVNGNSLAEIEISIEKLIENKELSKKFGDVARNWTNENLSWARHVNKIVLKVNDNEEL